MEEKEVILKVYQNVLMGLVGIKSVKDKIQSKELLDEILKQKKQYDSIKHALESLCKKYHVEDKELGSFVQMESDMMVNMKMMIDNSDAHIAKMMMEGTNKGLIQLEELLNHYEGKEQKIISIIQNLIRFEHEKLDTLKKYL